LISIWNLITRSGHMSITTTPEEYRERFLNMCREIVAAKGQPGAKSDNAPNTAENAGHSGNDTESSGA
jgi:hypothetical protein